MSTSEGLRLLFEPWMRSEGLRFLLPTVAAVVAVAVASATPWGRRPGRVFALAATSAVAFALWYVGSFLVVAGTGRNNLLVRDVVGLVLVSAAAPALAAMAVAVVRPRTCAMWAPAALAGVVGGAWVLASPFLLLLIHCSSGDCL